MAGLTDEMIDAGFEAANAHGLMNDFTATETVKVISDIYAAMRAAEPPQDNLTYCNGP